MKFLGKGFQVLEHEQTDTDRRDRTHYCAALAGSNNGTCLCVRDAARVDGGA